MMFLDSLFGNVSPIDKSSPSNIPLRAHAYDGARGRADEGNPFLREAVGELRVLAEEAVSRVDGLWNMEGAAAVQSVKMRENARGANGDTHLGSALMADLDDLVYTELREVKKIP